MFIKTRFEEIFLFCLFFSSQVYKKMTQSYRPINVKVFDIPQLQCYLELKLLYMQKAVSVQTHSTFAKIKYKIFYFAILTVFFWNFFTEPPNATLTLALVCFRCHLIFDNFKRGLSETGDGRIRTGRIIEFYLFILLGISFRTSSLFFPNFLSIFISHYCCDKYFEERLNADRGSL